MATHVSSCESNSDLPSWIRPEFTAEIIIVSVLWDLVFNVTATQINGVVVLCHFLLLPYFFLFTLANWLPACITLDWVPNSLLFWVLFKDNVLACCLNANQSFCTQTHSTHTSAVPILLLHKYRQRITFCCYRSGLLFHIQGPGHCFGHHHILTQSEVVEPPGARFDI